MQKLGYPDAGRNVGVKVEGVFGFPEEWRTTDEGNPGLFTYAARWMKLEFEKGKIHGKELTAKELREQEDKNKKGGKKESKKEDGNAEEERIRKLEEEEERKRQEEWTKRTEEDRHYRNYQDPFKSAQLRFENAAKNDKFTGKDFVILEERVREDHGEWIYLYKLPAVSEDELAKMRKAKPKTLNNINDLNPVVMRAWVDLSSLNSKDKKTVTLRAKLQQVDKTPETPEPNLEHTYVKVTVSLDEPFIKGEDGIKGQALIADPPGVEPVSERVKVVGQLRDELRLAIESLAMQYSGMFFKQLNIYDQLRNMNYFINKKGDINKRKEHFLYDFNVSGKYKILKDRLKKTIVHLCEKYFTEQMAGSKSFTGVSCSIKDQFYSEIYNFLVAKYKQALRELVFEKQESLNEVEVLSPSAQTKNIEKMLSSFKKETAAERASRIIEQYEALGNFSYGQNLLKRLIEAQPSNVGLKYTYAMYCIKNSLKKVEEVLPFVEEYLSHNKGDQTVKMQYLLLLVASENEENCKKAWVLLREIIQSGPNDSRNLALASLIFKDYLNSEALGQRYGLIAQRAVLRHQGKLPQNGKHKEAAVASELPTLKAIPAYSQVLQPADKDKLWIDILKLFLGLNMFNVIEKVQSRIKETGNPIFDVLKLKNLLSEKKTQQFEKQATELFEKSKSQEILELIVNYFLQKESEQAEKYLKIWISRAKGERQVAVLLKMSNYYLKKGHYGNARACILKYLEKKPENSGYSWRILGICELNLGQTDNALECLRKANISDISNRQNWLWLANIYTMQGNFVMCNQCINQYELISPRLPSPIYASILQQLKRKVSPNLCEEKLRVKLVERLEVQE